MVADCNPFTSGFGYYPEQIVLVGIFYRNFTNIAGLQRVGHIAQEDISVNFRRIRLAARSRADAAIFVRFPDFIDDDGQSATNFGSEFCSTDRGSIVCAVLSMAKQSSGRIADFGRGSERQ